MTDRFNQATIESDERVWFVTGVSSGFGRALAETVLDAGDVVAGTLRREDQFERFRALATDPDRILPVLVDVTDPDAVRAGIQAALDRFGRIDVLVNNAGYGLMGAIEEVTDEQIYAQLAVNFFGALDVTRVVLPHMRERGTGHVIQVSSYAGQVGIPGFGIYNASKWALEGFSEALAKEVAPFGIRVTIVEPGAFRTEWAGRSMTRAEPIDAYAETVGGIRDAVAEIDGVQSGDPRKGARAMIDVVDSDDPPLRLPLGNDSVDVIREKLETQLAELDAYEDVSRATDFDAETGVATDSETEPPTE